MYAIFIESRINIDWCTVYKIAHQKTVHLCTERDQLSTGRGKFLVSNLASIQ